jgi:hypothetical protein
MGPNLRVAVTPTADPAPGTGSSTPGGRVLEYNYADLPLWDMIFGTFRNPRRWNERCGFGDGEMRLTEMLMGKDVNEAPPDLMVQR